MRLIITQPPLRAFDTALNFRAIREALAPFRGGCRPCDIVLLPEHVSFEEDADRYRDAVASIAVEWGCYVFGGTHHEKKSGGLINTGAVLSPTGELVGYYEKLRPYGDERRRVQPGTEIGEFVMGGFRILVLVCADFWFSDLFLRARTRPDIVLVPALSVSRKTSPEYSRTLWEYLAVSRAYEFGVFVGISDWALSPIAPHSIVCGVGGFADPTTIEPASFYRRTGEKTAEAFEIDGAALESFRQDRRARGFFWKED
ncbi:MAG: carbon-nitrogen hydrolase family protein [Bacteroidota bacterium]|nr:carbon-nitrogen hydrolase family protein [Bacteroidota bacterium]